MVSKGASMPDGLILLKAVRKDTNCLSCQKARRYLGNCRTGLVWQCQHGNYKSALTYGQNIAKNKQIKPTVVIAL